MMNAYRAIRAAWTGGSVWNFILGVIGTAAFFAALIISLTILATLGQ